MKKGHQSADNNKPLSKGDIKKNPDKHIDQDFPGYPNNPGNEDTIDPKDAEDKVNANLIKKNKTPKTKRTDTEEQQSDGSANAFEGTENEEILREELNDDEPNY